MTDPPNNNGKLIKSVLLISKDLLIAFKIFVHFPSER